MYITALCYLVYGGVSNLNTALINVQTERHSRAKEARRRNAKRVFVTRALVDEVLPHLDVGYTVLDVSGQQCVNASIVESFGGDCLVQLRDASRGVLSHPVTRVHDLLIPGRNPTNSNPRQTICLAH